MATSLIGQAQVLWTVGLNDGGWPLGDGGGANASFMQENGSINPLPGSPESPETNGQSDNDYYFAGEYTTVLTGNTGNGDYVPVGTVAANEESAERAFAGGDLDLRYHFNLPNTLLPTDLLSVTFEPFNLDTGNIADPRFGVEVYFNGVLIQDQIVVRPVQTGKAYTTPQFTLASVDGQVGPGFDNIVSLRGITYSGEGGGNWMGVDYIQLNEPGPPIPSAVFPWNVGRDDNLHAVGDGGGPNATFVQENGAINPLPGSPTSPEANGQADNDYYLAGSYTTALAGNGAYAPVGLVPVNEEGAERAFAGDDNELRYHFNLPNSVTPNDLVAVSFDALSLDTSAADPRYGVEVYVNGVKVMPEVVIRPAQLHRTFTTPPFRMSFVNADVGPGPDNIVSLRGINHSAEGGGSWMGIDYVAIAPATAEIPPAVLPWTVGIDDDLHPVGDGGGPNATFVQENGAINPLPGSPTSPEVNGQADNDYYFAGSFNSAITGNGVYSPAGLVAVNEEAAERAVAGADNDLRFHFNLPSSLTPNDVLSVTFDALSLQGADATVTDPRYGAEVYVNNVLVQPQIVIRPGDLGTDYTTPRFTLASVNAQVGPGFDNIVSLRGINYSAEGGGSWMGIDYLRLDPHPLLSFPWAVGRDDNGWPHLNGGGTNASFVQENGVVNALPGNPLNAEIDQQGDNDYYFSGTYTTPIDSVVASYGDYTPLGLVLSNEESAERALTDGDAEMRYHFNLPSSLTPTDMVTVAFDLENLHIDAATVPDPRRGIEVYFNGVQVQPEILIRPPDLRKYRATPAFSLGSVNAQFGAGADNIVTLKGVSYSADGGAWMGIDYVQLNPVTSSGFPLAVGLDDNAQPAGNGGGPNATFVQEGNGITPLPGSPVSPEVDQLADNDYYFAGLYTTPISSVVTSYGDYTPVGLVGVNEEAAERALAGADNDLRYHFNLPSSFQPTDKLSVVFDAVSLQGADATVTDPRYGVEVYFNGVLVRPETIIRPAELDVDYTTPEFTLASVNAQVGPGADNIVSLKGINYSTDGGGNWMGIDYVQINGTTPAPFLPPNAVVNNGQVTLTWAGPGNLEWSSTLVPPWTPIIPAPASPYSEPIAPEGARYYRLRRP